MKYGILERYVQNFDVICLTETKTDLIETQWFRGYSSFVMDKCSDSFAYGGVHGMCVLVKDNISSSAKIIGGTSPSSIMWMYLRNTPCDVVLGSVYIPCENSKHYSDELFQNLLSDIALIEGKFKAPIIVAGDFNARTGSMSDVIAEDIASGSDR